MAEEENPIIGYLRDMSRQQSGSESAQAAAMAVLISILIDADVIPASKFLSYLDQAREAADEGGNAPQTVKLLSQLIGVVSHRMPPA